MKFEENYWQELYKKPEEMDGVGNAQDHADYLKAFFELEGVKINSMIDFGFGPGVLLKKISKKLKPNRIEGIEPSLWAYKKFKFKPAKLSQVDIVNWCEQNKKNKLIYDLGISTSVFQYLTEADLKKVIPVLSKKVRYLYLTVPTDIEYKRQVKEHGYQKDPYASYRTQKFYYKLLSPHFTFISMRVLDSKAHFSEKNTPFNDLLFRF